MNLRLMDSASAAYTDLPQDDVNRLVFFRSIWGLQAQAIADAPDDYQAPNVHDLTLACTREMPVFKMQPPTIDVERLASTARDIADCISSKKMLGAESQSLLERAEWGGLLQELDMQLAASDPTAFLELIGEGLVSGGASEQAALTGVNVLSMALRCQLEKPAQAVVKALKDDGIFEDLHPLSCPCCGTEPTLAHVGGKTSSQGRGRLLVCAQCGCAWEFERIRCARCGQKNPNHLHYYSIEGDDAHRIATCDDCGGYMRTLFSEEGDLRPVSYEVEDVIMARLDALAADGRFNA